MSWTIKTNSSRIPWVEKKFTSRSFFQEYLDYFGIEDYAGPGHYKTPDGSDLYVVFENDC